MTAEAFRPPPLDVTVQGFPRRGYGTHTPAPRIDVLEFGRDRPTRGGKIVAGAAMLASLMALPGSSQIPRPETPASPNNAALSSTRTEQQPNSNSFTRHIIVGQRDTPESLARKVFVTKQLYTPPEEALPIVKAVHTKINERAPIVGGAYEILPWNAGKAIADEVTSLAQQQQGKYPELDQHLKYFLLHLVEKQKHN